VFIVFSPARRHESIFISWRVVFRVIEQRGRIIVRCGVQRDDLHDMNDDVLGKCRDTTVSRSNRRESRPWVLSSSSTNTHHSGRRPCGTLLGTVTNTDARTVTCRNCRHRRRLGLSTRSGDPQPSGRISYRVVIGAIRMLLAL